MSDLQIQQKQAGSIEQTATASVTPTKTEKVPISAISQNSINQATTAEANRPYEAIPTAPPAPVVKSAVSIAGIATRITDPDEKSPIALKRAIKRIEFEIKQQEVEISQLEENTGDSKQIRTEIEFKKEEINNKKADIQAKKENLDKAIANKIEEYKKLKSENCDPEILEKKMRMIERMDIFTMENLEKKMADPKFNHFDQIVIRIENKKFSTGTSKPSSDKTESNEGEETKPKSPKEPKVKNEPKMAPKAHLPQHPTKIDTSKRPKQPATTTYVPNGGTQPTTETSMREPIPIQSATGKPTQSTVIKESKTSNKQETETQASPASSTPIPLRESPKPVTSDKSTEPTQTNPLDLPKTRKETKKEIVNVDKEISNTQEEIATINEEVAKPKEDIPDEMLLKQEKVVELPEEKIGRLEEKLTTLQERKETLIAHMEQLPEDEPVQEEPPTQSKPKDKIVETEFKTSDASNESSQVTPHPSDRAAVKAAETTAQMAPRDQPRQMVVGPDQTTEQNEEHVIKGPEDTDSSGEGGEGDKGGQDQNDQGREDNSKK